MFHATHLHVTQLGVRNLHLPPYAAQETKKGGCEIGAWRRSRGHLEPLGRRFDGAGGVVKAAGEALLLLLLLHPLEHLEDLEELGPLDRAVA